MRPVALTFNALAALVAVAVAFGGPGPRAPERTGFMLAGATGALELSSSRPGAAILHGEAMRPGAQVAGTVTIGAVGRDVAALSLRASSVDRALGNGGGRLSDRMLIGVWDVTAPAAPVRVYLGPLATLGPVALGPLAATGARTFRLVASLPEAAGDEYQGARMSADFTWSAQAAEGAVPATPATPPPPTPPATTPQPGTGEALSDGRCRARRRVAIRLRTPRGVRIRSIRVTVDGRVTRHVKRIGRRVTVRRLPRRTARVKVVVRLADGRRQVVKRTVRRCRAPAKA